MTMGDSKIAVELAEDLNGLLDHFVNTQEEQGKAQVAVQELQSEQDNLKGQLEVRNAATMELEQDLQNLEEQLEKKEEEKLSVTGDLAIAEENLEGLRVKAAVPVSPEDQDKNVNNGVQEGKVADNKKSRDVTREARPSSRRSSSGDGSAAAAAAAAAAIPADSKRRTRRHSGLTNSSGSNQQAAVVSEDDNAPRVPHARAKSDSMKIPSKSRRSTTSGLSRQNSLDSGTATRRTSTSSRDDNKKHLLGSKPKDSVSKRRGEEGEGNTLSKESMSRRRGGEGEGVERRPTRSRPSTQSTRPSKNEKAEVEASGSSTSALKKTQTMDPSNHSSTIASSELSGNEFAGDDDIDDEDDLDATLVDVALRFQGDPSASVKDVPNSVNSDTRGSKLHGSSRSARTTGTRTSSRTSTQKPLSSGSQSSSRKLQTKANISLSKDKDSEKITESVEASPGTPKNPTNSTSPEKMSKKNLSSTSHRSSSRKDRPEILRSNSFTSGSKSKSSEKLAPLLMPPSEDEEADLEQLQEGTPKADASGETKITKSSKTSTTSKHRSSPKEDRPEILRSNSFTSGSKSKSSEKLAPLLMPTSSNDEDAPLEQLHESTNKLKGSAEVETCPSSPKNDASGEPQVTTSPKSSSSPSQAQTSPKKSPLTTREQSSSPKEDRPEMLRSNNLESSEKLAPLLIPTSSNDKDVAPEQLHESTSKLKGNAEVETCTSFPKNDASGEPQITTSPKSSSSPSQAQTSPKKSPLTTSELYSSSRTDKSGPARASSFANESKSESSDKLAPLLVPTSSNDEEAALEHVQKSVHKLEGDVDFESCIHSSDKVGSSEPKEIDDLVVPNEDSFSEVEEDNNVVQLETEDPIPSSIDEPATPNDDRGSEDEVSQNGSSSSELKGIENSVVPNEGSFSGDEEEEDKNLEKRRENVIQLESEDLSEFAQDGASVPDVTEGSDVKQSPTKSVERGLASVKKSQSRSTHQIEQASSTSANILDPIPSSIDEPVSSNDDSGSEDEAPKNGNSSELKGVENSVVPNEGSFSGDEEEEDKNLEKRRENVIQLESEDLSEFAQDGASVPDVTEGSEGSDVKQSPTKSVERGLASVKKSQSGSTHQIEQASSTSANILDPIPSSIDEPVSSNDDSGSEDEAEDIQSEAEQVAYQPSEDEPGVKAAPVFEGDGPEENRSRSTGKRSTRRASLTNFMGSQTRRSRIEDESCAFDPGPRLEDFVPNQVLHQYDDESSQYDSGSESAQLKNGIMHQPVPTQSDEESASCDFGAGLIEQGKSESWQGPGMECDDSPPIKRTQSVEPSNHSSTIASELGELSGNEFAGDELGELSGDEFAGDDEVEDEDDLDATLADVALRLEGRPTESLKHVPAGTNSDTRDSKVQGSTKSAKSARPSRRRSTQKTLPISKRQSSRRVKTEVDPSETNSSTTKKKKAAGKKSEDLQKTPPREDSLAEPEKPDLANMWRSIFNPNTDSSRQKNGDSLKAGAKGTTRHFYEDLVLPALFPSEDDSDADDENENRSSLFDHEGAEEGNSSDDSRESSAESDHEEPGELIPQINFDGSVLQRELVQPNEGLAHLKTPYKRKDKLKAPKSLLSKTSHPLGSSRHTHKRKTGRHPATRDALANSTWHGTTTSAKLSEGEEDDDKTPPKFVYQMSLNGSVSKKELSRAARRGDFSRIKNPEEFEIPAKTVAKSAKTIVKSEMPEDPVEANAGSAQLAPKFDALGKSAHAAMKLKWSRRSRTKDHGELLDEPKATVDETTDFDALAKMKWARRSRTQELSEEPQSSVDEAFSAETKAEALAKSAATAKKWSDRSRLISDPAQLFAGQQASADEIPSVETKAKPEFKGKGNPDSEALSKSITNAMKWKRRSKVKDIVAASQGSSQTDKGVASGADANPTTDALAKLQTAMKWTRRSRGRDTDMQMLDDDEGSLD